MKKLLRVSLEVVGIPGKSVRERSTKSAHQLEPVSHTKSAYQLEPVSRDSTRTDAACARAHPSGTKVGSSGNPEDRVTTRANGSRTKGSQRADTHVNRISRTRAKSSDVGHKGTPHSEKMSHKFGSYAEVARRALNRVKRPNVSLC